MIPMEQEKAKIDDPTMTNENTDNQTAEPIGAGTDETTGNETEKLAAELAEAKEKYLRLLADFENFRRRTAKEKMEYLKGAQEEIVRAILPTLDDFERAQKSLANVEDIDLVREGIQIIYHKLYKTLEQKGLKPIEATGKNFDLELHESITQAPAPSEDLKGKVIDEVEKGYQLNDKVIRFAKVIIGA